MEILHQLHHAPNCTAPPMTIKEIQKNGQTRFRVSFQMRAKPVRRFFKTLHEAQQFAETIKNSEGDTIQLFLGLPAGKQAIIMEAFAEAEATGVNIYAAVQQAASKKTVVSKRKVDELVLEFFDAKADLRHNSQKSLRNLLTLFSTRHGGRAISSITVADCREFLFADGLAAETVRGYRTRLATFFNWCKDEGLIGSNPADGVKIKARAQKTISYLNTEQCRTLLMTAKHNDPALVPNIALGLFAGVRAGEIAGQKDKRGVAWEEIYLDRPEPELEVAEDVGKTGRRMVPISPNLAAWLERGGDCYPIKNLRKRMEAVREEAKLGELGKWDWGGSILRHTFATMHVAAHKKPELTKYIMGHEENSQTFRRHYDGRVSPTEAVKFWEIYP